MEAADLGVRLCQTAARSVYPFYLVVAIPIVILAVASVRDRRLASDPAIWWLETVARPHDPVRALACRFRPADDVEGSLGGRDGGVVRPGRCSRWTLAAAVVVAGVDAAGLPARRRRLSGGAARVRKLRRGAARSGVPDHAGLQPVRARDLLGVHLAVVLVRARGPCARHLAVLRQRKERDRRDRVGTVVRRGGAVPRAVLRRRRASRSISTGGPRSRPGTSSRSSDVPSRGEAHISGPGAPAFALRATADRRDRGWETGRRAKGRDRSGRGDVCVRPAAAYAAQEAALDHAAVAAGHAPEFDGRRSRKRSRPSARIPS